VCQDYFSFFFLRALINFAYLINSLEEQEMDSPLGLSSGAADIFANTGGQPRFTTDVYEEYLKEPLGEKSHHLLHTKYEERAKV